MAFVIAVATAAGTFHPSPRSPKAPRCEAGQVLGHIVTRQSNADVTAHSSGRLIEWLASLDD